MLDTIKQYLVGLGFSLDKASYDKTMKAVSSLESGAQKFASKFVKTFGKASAAIIAFGLAATTATAKFLGGLGNEEIQMEMLSRQLWTTQQQARAFSATLKALGANLQDLYLSPTLMVQYEKLHGVALQMQTPGDYNSEIKQVQSVQLQIKQMKLEAYYSLQWIGYYFIKYMAGPISKVKGILTSINSVIVKNMPTWTKRVAEVMASFMQAGIYIVQAMSNVYHWLQKMLAYVPGWAKGIAAALAIFGLSNPFMLFIEAIGGAILLLDDFETYLKDPSKSAFPKFWAWVLKITDAMKKMGVGKTVSSDVTNAFKTLGHMLQETAHFAKNLYSVFKENGTFSAFKGNIKSVMSSVNDLGRSIGKLITSIGDLYAKITNSKNQNGLVSFFQMIADVANTALQAISGAIDAISFLASAISDVLQGHWKAAANFINLIDGAGGTLPASYFSDSNRSDSQTSKNAKTHASRQSSQMYMYPRVTNNSSKTTHVNANQTVHVHGSSPHGTAEAVTRGYNRHLHNIKGVIG